MDPTFELTWEAAKQIIDSLLFKSNGKYLSDTELLVLQGAWDGKSYSDIAEENGYSTEYINSDVGFTLWSKLSKATGEKVTKRNFRRALLRQVSIPSAIPLPSTSSDYNPQYIARPPIESQCFEAIQNPGALIRIKAPKKMGKTLLLEHILNFAQEQGYQAVQINLMRIEDAILQDLDRFLKFFSSRVSRRLKLESTIETYWNESLGSNTSCTEYFEECILANCDRPIVLALDNTDRLFRYQDVASNFFSLLRAWYEDARIIEDWQKLRLIISHSTEVYPTLNVHRSPFNVGLAVELVEFTEEQISPILHEQIDRSDLKPLIEMVGGHPYLIQQAIEYLRVQPDVNMTAFLEIAPTEAGPYGQHLRELWEHIQQHPELATAMKSLVLASEPIRIKPEQGFILHSLGLVRLQGNEVELRCQLYRQYFCDRLEDL